MILLTLAIIFSAAAANAQTATVYGQLSNFDVVNNTDHDAHGFEIDLEGVQTGDIAYTFSAQRYGNATLTATTTGVRVHWASPYNGFAFAQTTIAHPAGTAFAGSCYLWGTNYDAAGCEHFGVSLYKGAVKTTYHWLIEDAQNPGTLVAVDPPVAIPVPVYLVTPPVQAGEPPVLEAQIEAPEPAERPELYGDAQWVKVFRTELNREVTLDELVSDNAVVPQDAAHAEVAWEIIQQEPASNSNGNRRQRRNQGSISFGTRSIIRRYEIYQFTGQYDPVTHEALCADLTCTTPAGGEVGDYIGAQMAAANVTANSVTVATSGNGSVSSADKLISCGNKCAAGYDRGTAVSLTASASSGSIFVGWAGSCTGNSLICTVNAADAMNVSATFAQTYNLVAKISGKGSVVGGAGIDCGRTCSAKVTQGTTLNFAATPEAGFRFTGWSGSCSGTSQTCTVAIKGDTTVQANFVKQ